MRRRLLGLAALAGLVVSVTVAMVGSLPAQSQAAGCTPPSTSNFAGTGPFSVTTQSDSVNTFYSPSSLGSQGCTRHPVILWGNGTFTTPALYDGLLRHLASHGFIVAAANTSNAGSGQEMLQGLATLTTWNGQSGHRFYQKVDLEHVGTTGHSQGGAGSIRAGADPRVDTVFPMAGPGNLSAVRVPVLHLVGADDPLKSSALSSFNSATGIPAAYAELAGADHLTFLGSAGGFRGPATAWARWQLMGDDTAKNQFVGASCGLCTGNDWTYQTNAQFRTTYGSGGGTTTTTSPGGGTTTTTAPGGGQCVTATNSAHVQADRATSLFIFAFAAGSGNYLGLTWSTTSLRQTAPDAWTRVESC
jgi:Chlorophyllase enzyme